MENHRREINQTGQKRKRRDGKIFYKGKEKDTMKENCFLDDNEIFNFVTEI